MSIRGVWINPDKTKLIIREDGGTLTQVEPDSDDFARWVLDVPAEYTTLWVKGGEAPE